MAITSGGGGIDFQASLSLQDNFTPEMQAAAKAAETAMGTFGKLSTSVVVINQALELMGKAWNVASSIVSGSVGEYIEHEKSVNKLRFSLKLNGDAVGESVKHFENLTTSISKASTVSASNLMALAAQSKALGKSTEMTNKLLQASVDMASALDIDVNDAFNQLIGSLSGMARGIGRFVPELRDMTEEELRAGKAIDIVSKKFSGFSEVQSKTFLGRQKQIANAFEEIKEAIGELAVTAIKIPGGEESLNLAKILYGFADTIKGFKSVVEDVRNSVVTFFVALWEAIKKINWEVVARGIALVSAALTGLAIAVALPAIANAIPILGTNLALIAANAVLAAKAFGAMALSVAVVSVKIIVAAGAIATIVTLIELMAKNLERLPKLFGALALSVAGGLLEAFRLLFNYMSKVFRDPQEDIDKMNAKFDEFTANMAQTYGNLSEGVDMTTTIGAVFDESKKFIASFNSASEETSKKLANAANKAEEFGTKTKRSIGAAKALTDELKKQLEEIIKRTKESQQAIAEAGLTEGQIALLRAKTNIDTINALEAELKKRNMLTQTIRDQLEAARKSESGRGGVELDKIRVKLLEDAKKKYDEINQSLEKQNLTERQLVNIERQRTIAQIELLRAQAIANQVYGPDMVVALRDSTRAANELADSKLADLPRTFTDALEDFGKAKITFKQGMIWTGLIDAGSAVGSMIARSIETASKYISVAIEYGADVIGKLFRGEFINQLASVIESFGRMPEALLQAFSNLGTVIDGILSRFPQLVESLLQKVPGIVDKIVAAFPKMVDVILSSLPRIAEMIGQQMPRLLQSVLDALPKIISALPAILEPLIAAIPEIVTKIMDSLPDIIQSIFMAIPQVFASLLKAIPSIFENLLENIDKVVLAFVDGFIGAMGEIVGSFIDVFIMGGGLERIIGAILRAIPRIVVALVQGLARGLVRYFEGYFEGIFGGVKGMKIEAPKAITDLPKKLEGTFKKLGQLVQSDSSKLFAVKDFEKLSKGTRGIGDTITNSIKSFGEDTVDKVKSWWESLGAWFKDAWQKLINGLLDVWRFIYDNIIKPVIDALRAVWQFVYDVILKPFLDLLSSAWEVVRALFQTIYDTILKPFTDALSSAWTWVLDNIITPLNDLTTGAFLWIKDNIVTPLTSFKMPTFSWPDMPKFSWPVLPTFAWPKLPTWIWPSFSWPALPKFSWPSLPTWNWPSIPNPGWVTMFSEAIDRLLNWSPPSIGGGGSEERRILGIKYASGGIVPKTVYAANGIFVQNGTDTVPAMLTPGEFVVNRESASANLGLLAAINASRGQPVGGMSSGSPQQVVLNVTINAKTMLDAAQIRREVLPEIDKHLKRRSLDGAFVLATAGVQPAR